MSQMTILSSSASPSTSFETRLSSVTSKMITTQSIRFENLKRELRFFIPLCYILLALVFIVVLLQLSIIAFKVFRTFYEEKNEHSNLSSVVVDKPKGPETTLNILKKIRVEKLRFDDEQKRKQAKVEEQEKKTQTSLKKTSSKIKKPGNRNSNPVTELKGNIISEDHHHHYSRAWSPEKVLTAKEQISSGADDSPKELAPPIAFTQSRMNTAERFLKVAKKGSWEANMPPSKRDATSERKAPQSKGTNSRLRKK
uniref:Uncharacterized protein n=1 Tax=Ditylenchus dipsaci TaxID=166011 RepID=A0A915E5B3_9BILA